MEHRVPEDIAGEACGFLRFSARDTHEYPIVFANQYFQRLFPNKSALLDCCDSRDKARVRTLLQKCTQRHNRDIFFRAAANNQRYFFLMRVFAPENDSTWQGILLDVTKYSEKISHAVRRANRYREAVCADCVASFDVDILNNQLEYRSCPWQSPPTGSCYDAFLDAMCQSAVDAEDAAWLRTQLNQQALIAASQRGEQVIHCEYRSRQPQNTWMKCTMNLLQHHEPTPILYGFARITNIDEQKRDELLLRRVADFDELTGVYNRRAFMRQVDALVHTCTIEKRKHMLVMLDLDDFKKINDTHGHAHGDEALVSFAKSLRAAFRKHDLVARLGGDEFSVLMSDIEDEAVAIGRVEKLCHGVIAGCSAGAAVAPDDGLSFDVLYRRADLALYEAKHAGKGIVRAFHPAME